MFEFPRPEILRDSDLSALDPLRSLSLTLSHHASRAHNVKVCSIFSMVSASVLLSAAASSISAVRALLNIGLYSPLMICVSFVELGLNIVAFILFERTEVVDEVSRRAIRRGYIIALAVEAFDPLLTAKTVYYHKKAKRKDPENAREVSKLVKAAVACLLVLMILIFGLSFLWPLFRLEWRFNMIQENEISDGHDVTLLGRFSWQLLVANAPLLLGQLCAILYGTGLEIVLGGVMCCLCSLSAPITVWFTVTVFQISLSASDSAIGVFLASQVAFTITVMEMSIEVFRLGAWKAACDPGERDVEDQNEDSV